MTKNLPALPIYLDYQATTPTDPRVVEAMLPYFTEQFGNPHSGHHAFGAAAAGAVETARAQVAALIGADPREIIFTSGATESNNLALAGVARFQRNLQGDRKTHLVTAATEHKCVLESAAQLEREGFAVTYLPVGRTGLIDLERLAAAITERTVLVSIMAVNNEIGVVQPLAEIGALCRARGVHFHTDAAQAVGKIPLDVEAMNIDLMSLSGHKIYGPKGIGALYVRRRPRVRLAPLFQGGGQERGLRSGTLPTPLCVGLGAACEIAMREMAPEADRLRRLAARLHQGVVRQLPDAYLNGDPGRRVPGNLNLGFPGIDGDRLIGELKDLAVSSGSACSSAALEPSYVLRALGLDEAQARASLRIGLGRFTTEAEVDYAVERLVAAVQRLRDGPPAAAIVPEGADAPSAPVAHR
ncbi:IscS subfamily cysteine desulfurase [Rhodospirillaceae bacterium SYSU D60014]|uniref:IscS subfamily cysteine desulfurase n=1 Tax=Virgifigura deserti TaxID=2268457 RepID=UPI000E675E08